VNPRKPSAELSDEQLLVLSRPAGWQRLCRAVGCPGGLLLGYFSADQASSPWMEGQPVVGWLVALLVFFVATPLLLSVIASLSSFSLRHARDELRRRLGQEDFKDALAGVEQEIAALPEGNEGWILLIRGHLVTSGHRTHVRLDLRRNRAAPTAYIDNCRGPRLNLFGDEIEELSAWQRSSRDLDVDESGALDQLISSLKPDSFRDDSAGSKLWLKIALFRVGGDSTVTQCRMRMDCPDQTELPAFALVKQAWQLAGWRTDEP